jgi:hypothetical protein
MVTLLTRASSKRQRQIHRGETDPYAEKRPVHNDAVGYAVAVDVSDAADLALEVSVREATGVNFVLP